MQRIVVGLGIVLAPLLVAVLFLRLVLGLVMAVDVDDHLGGHDHVFVGIDSTVHHSATPSVILVEGHMNGDVALLGFGLGGLPGVCEMDVVGRNLRGLVLLVAVASEGDGSSEKEGWNDQESHRAAPIKGNGGDEWSGCLEKYTRNGHAEFQPSSSDLTHLFAICYVDDSAPDSS
jgi:hypothetical protein